MNYYAQAAATTQTATTRACSGSSTPPRPGLGYLAFPGGRPPALVDAPAIIMNSRARAGEADGVPPPAPAPAPKPPSTPTHAPPQPGSRSRARALEQAEAERGELEWVACGGVLRDGRGNVDVGRTKRVREEVERREKERVVKARWDGYEEAWRGLLSSAPKGKEKEKDVVFGDVPWPVWVEEGGGKEAKLTMTISLTGRDGLEVKKKRRIIALADITVDRVQDFLLEPLSIRGSTITPKARIRSSFLRWHPDKLGWLIDRVKDDDVDDVKTGIGIVMECLQRMNEALKPS
jgi:hypothetical protein